MTYVVVKDRSSFTTIDYILDEMYGYIENGTALNNGEAHILQVMSKRGTHENGFTFFYRHTSEVTSKSLGSKSRTFRVIKSLKEKGIIEPVENITLGNGKKLFSGYDETRPNSPVLYRMNWDALMAMIPEDKRHVFISDNPIKGNLFKFLTEDERSYEKILSDLGETERTTNQPAENEVVDNNDTTPDVTKATYELAMDVLLEGKELSKAIEEARELGELDANTWNEVLSRNEEKLSEFTRIIERDERRVKEKKTQELIEQDVKRLSNFHGRSGYNSNIGAMKRVRQGYDTAADWKRTLVSTGSYIPEMWKDMLPNNWQMTPEEKAEFDEANEQ